MRRSPRSATATRSGFTLVELLVATALTILIMAIMATAFQTGMDTLSQLKSVVGMSEQLRSAQTVIERDLTAPHLEDDQSRPYRISDPLVTKTAWASPNRGYFAIFQPNTPMQNTNPTPAPPPALQYNANPNYTYLDEGSDGFLDSFRATDQILQMTVQLSGASPHDAFTCPAPNALAASPTLSMVDYNQNPSNPQQLITRWAEVSYFLRQTAILSSGANGTTPLNVYTLYRRQRLLTPSSVEVANTKAPLLPPADPTNPAYSFPDLSLQRVLVPAQGGNPAYWSYQTNTPDTVTNSKSRLGGASDPTLPVNPPIAPPDSPPTGWPLITSPPATAGDPDIGRPSVPYPHRILFSNQYYGADVLLNNVLSFQIQVMTDSPPPTPTGATPSVFQFTDVPNAAGARTGSYDTASPGVKPRLKAIQIKLRVYDTKNQMTRQITITQDL